MDGHTNRLNEQFMTIKEKGKNCWVACYTSKSLPLALVATLSRRIPLPLYIRCSVVGQVVMVEYESMVIQSYRRLYSHC